MLGNTISFKLLSDHETCNILKEHERNLSLAAQLNEVCAFLGALTEEDTVVSDNTHWVPVDVTEASDQSVAEKFLEFVEAAAVQDAAQHGVHVKLPLRVNWDDAVEILSGKQRILRSVHVNCVLRVTSLDVEVMHNSTGDLKRVRLVVSEMVTDS